MKKTIEFFRDKDSWICELEVSEFPSFLKRDKCQECYCLHLDSTEKDLVFAQRIVEFNGKKVAIDFSYRCFHHSRFIFDSLQSSFEEIIEVKNPQALEDIRKELRKHEPRTF